MWPFYRLQSTHISWIHTRYFAPARSPLSWLHALSLPPLFPFSLRARGTEWGLSIFGILSLFCAPLPFILYVSFSDIRSRTRVDMRADHVHLFILFRGTVQNCERGPNTPRILQLSQESSVVDLDVHNALPRDISPQMINFPAHVRYTTA